MENFKIGDIVISLTNPPNPFCQPRVKGKQYEIKAISYCMSCGSQQINIGHTAVVSNYISCECGSTQQNNGLRWTSSKHFIKQEDIEETIAMAVEEENYDIAIMLRDLK